MTIIFSKFLKFKNIIDIFSNLIIFKRIISFSILFSL